MPFPMHPYDEGRANKHELLRARSILPNVNSARHRLLHEKLNSGGPARIGLLYGIDDIEQDDPEPMDVMSTTAGILVRFKATSDAGTGTITLTTPTSSVTCTINGGWTVCKLSWDEGDVISIAVAAGGGSGSVLCYMELA